MFKLWKSVPGTNWKSFRSRCKENLCSYNQIELKILTSSKKSLHSIGPMDEVMEVEQVVNKGHITNNLEIFMYIERNPFLIIN